MRDEDTNLDVPLDDLGGGGDGGPYSNVDTSRLPEWWQDAISEFERHGIRPYRPPRFADGEYKFRVVERLEDTFDVTIDFVGKNVEPGDPWAVRIDGEPIRRIGHRRSAEGYSVFEMDSDEFAEVVSAHLS